VWRLHQVQHVCVRRDHPRTNGMFRLAQCTCSLRGLLMLTGLLIAGVVHRVPCRPHFLHRLVPLRRVRRHRLHRAAAGPVQVRNPSRYCPCCAEFPSNLLLSLLLPRGARSGFKHRPKVFSKAEEVNAKNGLRKKAEDLVAVGEKLGKDMIVRAQTCARVWLAARGVQHRRVRVCAVVGSNSRKTESTRAASVESRPRYALVVCRGCNGVVVTVHVPVRVRRRVLRAVADGSSSAASSTSTVCSWTRWRRSLRSSTFAAQRTTGARGVSMARVCMLHVVVRCSADVAVSAMQGALQPVRSLAEASRLLRQCHPDGAVDPAHLLVHDLRGRSQSLRHISRCTLPWC
jgi:hypothetical protein